MNSEGSARERKQLGRSGHKVCRLRGTRAALLAQKAPRHPPRIKWHWSPMAYIHTICLKLPASLQNFAVRPATHEAQVRRPFLSSRVTFKVTISIKGRIHDVMGKYKTAAARTVQRFGPTSKLIICDLRRNSSNGGTKGKRISSKG